MRRGYKKLLAFIVSLILILLINTFALNILSGYKMIVFLIALLIILKFYSSLEKDNNRYFKNIVFEIILYVLFYFVLFYTLGLIVGLVRTKNYISFVGIKDVLLPIILYTILREILRYNLLCKADENQFYITLTVILLILFDITDDFYYANFNSSYDVLRFVALVFLPIVARNISYSYISKKVGYKPIIIFDLIFTLYPYILPIIPNPNEYITSIIYLLVPVLFTFKIIKFFLNKGDDDIPSNYHKKKFALMILPIFWVITMVYFYSGYFKYYAVAIASGSMEPEIKTGDVVIVNQKYSYDDLKVGQVIAFRHNKIIVVHRIAKKVKVENENIYYTKGDANNNIDDYIIEKNMIIGKIEYKIPYIGLPTVWFNS